MQKEISKILFKNGYKIYLLISLKEDMDIDTHIHTNKQTRTNTFNNGVKKRCILINQNFPLYKQGTMQN